MAHEARRDSIHKSKWTLCSRQNSSLKRSLYLCPLPKLGKTLNHRSRGDTPWEAQKSFKLSFRTLGNCSLDFKMFDLSCVTTCTVNTNTQSVHDWQGSNKHNYNCLAGNGCVVMCAIPWVQLDV